MTGIMRNGEHVDVSDGQIHPVVVADPDDDLIIACAVVGKATHLVTYDPHILDLANELKIFTILNGLDFLRLIRGDEGE